MTAALKPVAGIDFDANAPMEPDDHEWFTSTGQYAGCGWAEQKRHGAKLRWWEQKPGLWRGILPATARDSQDGDLPVGPAYHGKYVCRIDVGEHRPAVTFGNVTYPERTITSLTTQGRASGGRRHRLYNSLEEAKRAAEKWAARRFYTLGKTEQEPSK